MKAYKLIAIFLAVFSVAAQAATYYITGSGTSISASKVSAGGTAITNGSGVTFPNVLNAIRIDANGDPLTIQFGDGSAVLSGGFINFDGSATPAWGLITLTGKITSGTGSAMGGSTISLTNGVSIVSTADIENTNSNASKIAISNSDGTLSINGGTILGEITNNSTMTIGGGTIGSVSNYGTLIITGGTVNRKTNYGTIIEWTNPSATTYTAFTSDDIDIQPSTATAQWLNKDGKAGIGLDK